MKTNSKTTIDENNHKIFKRLALAFLLILIFCIPVFTLVKHIDYSNYLNLLNTMGTKAEEVTNYNHFSISNAIHTLNCILCVLTIIVQLIYWIPRWKESRPTKANIKEKLKKNWPIILLAIFMMWTSVGCIQAGMEMNAEIAVRSAKNIEDVPQRLVDIANWSSGYRMANTSNVYQNAADRAWFGCENLRDGYFSFMFYATVMLNVLMLGVNSEDKKKWVLRALLISSFIISFLDVLAFFRPILFNGVIDSARYTFNNSNHFAYYYTVTLIMSVVMFIKEKNIFFSGLAFINSLLYCFIMMFNNTFGAQIGIAIAMIFLLIVTLIRLVSRHKVKEFVKFFAIFLIFVYFCMGIGQCSSKRYTKGAAVFSITTFDFKFLGNQYRFCSNSFSEEQAEMFDLLETKLNGKQVLWGTTVTKLEKDTESGMTRNIRVLATDIMKILNFYVPGESEEPVTAQEKMAELEAKYPKVSGESFEEYSQRQAKIEEEFAEWFSKHSGDSVETVTEEEEVSDIEAIGSTGSGRGKVWLRSLDLMNQRPMFGWGLENLLAEFYNQFNISEGRTHNLLLQLGGCVGIPGVLMYYVATLALLLKCMYDVKLRKYSKKGLIIIGIVFVVATILVNVLVGCFTNKLLFNGIITVIMWPVLYMFIFFKNVRLRVKDWNYFEMISSAVFISYMIGSFFGNSAFYTSPYFMIFLGILAYEVLHKTSRFDEEQVLADAKNVDAVVTSEVKEEKIEEETKEIKDEPTINTNNNTKAKGNKNNKKKKRR